MSADETSEIFGEEPLERFKALSNLKPVAAGPERVFHLYGATRFGRHVALKCLSAAARGNELYEQMLFKEFEIGATVEHENVAAAADIVAHPELGVCIVRPWVAGEPLDRLMAAGLSREAALDIARQLAAGVAYLHGRGIVHRDLKPANIIVNPDTGALKIIDLGCGDSSDFDILKMPMGTRGYAGPQHMEGGADPRADLYSLGVVLGELSAAAGGVGVLRRLSGRLMSGRIDSADEVAHVLRPRRRVWPVIVFGAGVALAAAGAVLSLGREEAGGVVTDTVYVKADTVYIETELPPHIPTEPMIEELTRHVTDVARMRLEHDYRLPFGERNPRIAYDVMVEAEAYAVERAADNASLRIQLIAVAREAAAAEMRRFNASHPYVREKDMRLCQNRRSLFL